VCDSKFGLNEHPSKPKAFFCTILFPSIYLLMLLADMAVDGMDALGMAGMAASAALLVYASSGRATSSGQRDGKPFLMMGCGGLLISVVRLGAKTILKAEGPSRRSSAFPTISILRHFWRERLRRDPYPHGASHPAILKW
jgi:hypothetical protein